ncbi:hypothetical protein EAS64_33910 [Trebonia kvetii]|uniref:Dystroglycan-type cadherin-like domain-containing protein n=1 Tax=Trebonia kvetii TaxID=2480626 RepID=A0A6P2BRH9_9ACTN|nr:Ig domain-containing protein [Trebonia kvetii]TVZ01277.1 hypothetical protein EAS64_33910 [Trebonia kvetii]
MGNVTVDFTNVLTATDPLGAGLVLSEFPQVTPIPFVASATWNQLLTNLAPGHMRASLAWYGGNPGYGAGGSSRAPGTAAALVKAIKASGAVPLISFNGDTDDNNFWPNDGGSLVSYFNAGGGRNGGPVKYWSIGNEAKSPNAGGSAYNLNATGQGSARATLAAMLAADPTICVGAPAASFWDTSFLSWAAANLPGLGGLSYHAYDALDTQGNDNGHGGFYDTAEYYNQTGTMRGYKSGILYGVEELNVNFDTKAAATVAFASSWKNTCWIADVLGQVLSSGAHPTVYSDTNDPGLSIISNGTNGAPYPYGTPMPAYWGIGIWTGMNSQFMRYSNNFVHASTTYTNTSVSVYACDNGKIIAINKDTASHPLTIALTIPTGTTSGTYNVWASNANSPTSAITRVVNNAQFSGSTINYTIPAQTAISIDVTASGLVGNPGGGGGGGGSIVTSSSTLSVVQSSTGTVAISLSAAPVVNVTATITRTAGNTGLSVSSGGTLTFTPANYATPQNVTFTADASSTGAATFTVSTPSGSGYPNTTITVTETSSGGGGGGGGGGGSALLSQDYESGTNGTTITTGNSGGTGRNAWDLVSATNGATVQYSSAQAANGALSGAYTTSGTAGVAYTQWSSSSVGSQPVIYGRTYVYLTANPTTDTNIVEFWNGGTFGGGVMIANSGQLRLQNASFGEIGGGPTMPTGQWFRLEWTINAGAPGVASATVNWYNSPNGTAVSGTVTDTGGQYGTSGVISETHWGWCSSHASQPTMYLDNAALSTTGPLGPVGAPPAVMVTNPGPQTGTVGTSLSLSITATGSSLTYTASGLPAGLSISSTTGAISGTPTTAGAYSVTVTATDPSSNSANATFTWTIANAAGGGTPGTIPAITVTATAGGNASAGILLRVLALNNAALPAFPVPPNIASQSATGAHEATIIPALTGSLALAAEINFPATAAAPVAAAGNTAIDSVSDTVSSTTQDYGYGTFQSTATLTAGTPFTAGSTDAAAGGVAVLEIQPA